MSISAFFFLSRYTYLANVSHTAQSKHLHLKSITVLLMVLNMWRSVCGQLEKFGITGQR